MPVPNPTNGKASLAAECNMGLHTIETSFFILSTVNELGNFQGLKISTLSRKMKAFIVDDMK